MKYVALVVALLFTTVANAQSNITFFPADTLNDMKLPPGCIMYRGAENNITLSCPKNGGSVGVILTTMPGCAEYARIHGTYYITGECWANTEPSDNYGFDAQLDVIFHGYLRNHGLPVHMRAHFFLAVIAKGGVVDWGFSPVFMETDMDRCEKPTS